MGLTEDNNVIEAFPADRADQPLRVAVLPLVTGELSLPFIDSAFCKAET